MKKRKLKKKKGVSKPKTQEGSEYSLSVHSEIVNLQKNIEKLNQFSASTEERLQDIEIHVNLLTRLLTTLCVEKFGMRVGVLKRIIKRIEKEAIRDSQIMHLESLYKMPVHPEKKNPPHSHPKNDPWEDIS